MNAKIMVHLIILILSTPLVEFRKIPVYQINKHTETLSINCRPTLSADSFLLFFEFTEYGHRKLMECSARADFWSANRKM
jgi:hypothetical protein